jgi:hypothetical protein
MAAAADALEARIARLETHRGGASAGASDATPEEFWHRDQKSARDQKRGARGGARDSGPPKPVPGPLGDIF